MYEWYLLSADRVDLCRLPPHINSTLSAQNFNWSRMLVVRPIPQRPLWTSTDPTPAAGFIGRSDDRNVQS